MLRDARIRARIDISEIEARTKIRAKYLRALENEEWGLLPGSAYVKSFLRSYAEALGLDARLIVDEYRLRHEGPADFELQPIRPASPRERRERPRLPAPPWVVGLGVAIVLVIALFALGSINNGSSPTPAKHKAPTTTGAAPTALAPRSPIGGPQRRISLQILPSAPVYVCLVAAGQRLIKGLTLTPSSPSHLFHALRFELVLGSSAAGLRVDGHLLAVRPTTKRVGYVITAAGRRLLPQRSWPTCA